MNPGVLNNLTPLGADTNSVPIGADSRQSQNSSQGTAATAEEDRLDWDAHIAIAPNRRSGSIRVKLEYGGRGKPTPAEDPWA
jgi:hypothetical protein